MTDAQDDDQWLYGEDGDKENAHNLPTEDQVSYI